MLEGFFYAAVGSFLGMETSAASLSENTTAMHYQNSRFSPAGLVA